MHERFAAGKKAGDLPVWVGFRSFGNLSCFVVVNPTRSFDHAMHIRFGVGSFAWNLSETDM
jgi:hypothetical protein